MSMAAPGLQRAASIVLAAFCASCALLPSHRHWVATTAINPLPRAAAPLNADSYYADAAAAIDRRDYGRALELLQAARARTPQDVRVINAFGVVYDKLGRFDLSARYYAQALQLDPGSSIVTSNMAYSQRLQLAAAPRPRTVAPQGFAAVVAAPAAQARVAVAPGLTGRPLQIVDASGRAGGAEPTRAALVHLGWSAPRAGVVMAAAQAHSEILFAPENRVAAEALGRTLPGPVELHVCAGDCTGVSLTLGADAQAWRLPSPDRG
jgi:tetratricopeptide (TPR) repeat protein